MNYWKRAQSLLYTCTFVTALFVLFEMAYISYATTISPWFVTATQIIGTAYHVLFALSIVAFLIERAVAYISRHKQIQTVITLEQDERFVVLSKTKLLQYGFMPVTDAHSLSYIVATTKQKYVIADVDLLGRQVKVKPLDAIDLIDFTAPKFILLVDRKYQPEQFASKLEKLFNNSN